MDVDAYVLKHRETWNRLDELSKQSRLTGAEADELVDLYQRTATHLAVIKGSAFDPQLEAQLSAIVVNARSVVTGAQVPMLQTIARFFTVDFPVTVYRLRWVILVVAALSVVTALIIGFRVATVPGLEQRYISEWELNQLLNHDFEAYYSENPAGDFAAAVWLNNTLVAALSILTGIAVFPLLMVWWTNMESLGIMGGLMVGHGRADVFFGLILPHGLLELTGIFIAIATGLSLAWAVISPGPRTRARAVAENGRRAGAIALGLVVVFGVAGLIEAFLTPSGLPAAVRLGIGATVWLGFLLYIFIFGWRAHQAGETGDLTETGRMHYAPTEAAM